MKAGQVAKFKYENSAAKILKVDGEEVQVLLPTGEIRFEPPSTLEIITIVMEVFSFVKNLFAVKMPLEIKVGDRRYALNLRYDVYEGMVFANYRDELKKENLIGVAYGKNTDDAKKKLKEKMKKAGYL